MAKGAARWLNKETNSRQRSRQRCDCCGGLVPEDEKAKIVLMAEDDLMMLHFGLGQWVRNHLGLWGGNSALLQATGESNADDASGAIVRAFWLKLRNDLPKVH